jgi:carbon-monoxide dehydrogenase medium subunit
MYAFDYARPKTLGEAGAALAAAQEAKILAGGQSLLPAMKLRLARPGSIIDLGAVSELAGISAKDGLLTIGAMTTHAAVTQSADVLRAIPALAAMVEEIGDPQVRHRGTIGGSVANNDPAADYPAAILALGATVHTTKRSIAAEQFFKGLFETALDDHEIITRFELPVPERFGYAKFRNPASRFALVGVAVAKFGGDIRVAVTGAGESGVFRLGDAEAALTANFSAKALDGLKVDPANLMTDIHADAEYRAHLVAVMARRAVTAAGGA